MTNMGKKKFLPVRHFRRNSTALRAKAFLREKDKRLRFRIIRDRHLYVLNASSYKGLKRAHKILGKRWMSG